MSSFRRFMTPKRRQDSSRQEEDKPSPFRRLGSRRDPSTSFNSTSTLSQTLPPSRSQRSPIANQPLDISTITRGVKPALTSAATAPVRLPTSAPFQLSRLSVPYRLELTKLLTQSALSLPVLRKADAERDNLAVVMDNGRDFSVVESVLDTYIPYAISAWHESENLKSKGLHVRRGVVWCSGLDVEQRADVAYEGGLSLEVAMLLMARGINQMRQILETSSPFAMQNEDVLITHIRSLQAAAGIFAHVRDVVAPAAIAEFAGDPPPELVADTAGVFYTLALALAQALRIRRAIANPAVTNETLLAKISVGAADLTRDVLAKLDVLDSRISIRPQVRMCAENLLLLCRGWAYQYVGLTTTTESAAGVKAGAFKAARNCLEKAAKFSVFEKVASVDLDLISREYEDASRSNEIVYKHAVPDADSIILPAGKILASATQYTPPRLPEKDRAPEKEPSAQKNDTTNSK